MAVTVKSGETEVAEAVNVEDVSAEAETDETPAEMTVVEEAVMEVEEEEEAAEVVIAPFGWTNMAHQLARITVLLLRTFRAE